VEEERLQVQGQSMLHCETLSQKKKTINPGMVIHAFNPITPVTEKGA
jgi:hypothetical protein